MSPWLHAHAAALRDAIAHARRAPLATLLSIAVLALALALPLAGFVVVAGLARIAAQFDTDPQISVFLPQGATAKDRQALEKTLRGRPEVKKLRVITKEQALTDLQATEGVRDLLAGLAGNPLPDTLVITPTEATRAAVRALQVEIERLPGVGSAQVDAEWVERLERVLDTVRTLTVALASLLGAAVVALTFNTIRLQVLTRAAEIDVASLFGATRAWLRRPFLYFGALQGFAAGLLSVALGAGFVATLNRGLAGASTSGAMPGGLVHLSLELALTTSVVAAGLGWLGAWLFVWEHLGAGKPGRG
jgi:cell division transport system permease protein